MIPTWNQLRGAGELRILKVSYLMLAVIPVWHTTVLTWNNWAVSVEQRAVASAQSAVEHALNVLEESLPANANSNSEPQEVVELKKLSHQLASAKALADLPTETPAPTPPGTLNSPQAVAAMEKVTQALNRHVKVPKLHFDSDLRWLFAGMVAISIANVLYGVFCPAALSVVHRPSRQGRAHGLGDEIDWCLQLFNVAYQGQEKFKEQRRLLVSRVLAKDPTQTWDDPAGRVLAFKSHLERRYLLIRVLCSVLYFFGLGVTAVLLLGRTLKVIAQ